MRYQLYGVINNSGINTYIGNYLSKKKAIEAVETEINTNVYKYFAILQKERQFSNPLRIFTGVSKTKEIFSVKPLVNSISNPLEKREIGKRYWEDITKNI